MMFPPFVSPKHLDAYLIAHACRFNDDDSPGLVWAPGAEGDRKDWTVSVWVKFATADAAEYICGYWNGGGTHDLFVRDGGGQLILYFDGSPATTLVTTDTFVDTTAWYHLVLSCSNGQPTLYVNGAAPALSTSNPPSAGSSWHFGDDVEQGIGRLGGSNDNHFDGYMAEYVFIDGTAYGASDFGQAVGGVWMPKDPSGLTFGTNGFHLQFNDSDDLGVSSQPGDTSQIPQAVGTVGGDMTSGGGNAAAFDGTDSKSGASSAETVSMDDVGVIGKVWGQERTITKYIVISPNDHDFAGYASGSSITVKLYGGSGAVGSSGAELHSDSFTTSGASETKTYTAGITTSTAYSTHWVEMTNDQDGSQVRIAQVKFFEDVTRFTPSNLTAADQVGDVPTNDVDNDAGNSLVLNPHEQSGSITLSEGNGTITGAGSAAGTVIVDVEDADGYYVEFKLPTGASTNATLGIRPVDDLITDSSNEQYIYARGGGGGNTWWTYDGASGTNQSIGKADNDVASLFVRGGDVWFAVNDTWVDGEPDTDTSPTKAGLTGLYKFIFYAESGLGEIQNGVIRPFTYAPPVGAKKVATFDLPDTAPSDPATGSFTGNGNADGPFVWLNATPDTGGTSTINSNTITWGTHALPMAGGFKVMTSSSSHNDTGAPNTFSIATGSAFKTARAI